MEGDSKRAWPKEKKGNKITKVVLFLISPFLALICSLNSLNTKSTYVVVFLFCLFFGMAFTVSDDRNEMTIDGVGYRQKFEQYTGDIGTTVLAYSFYDFITFSGEVKDMGIEVLAFGVSRITNNYHVFFLLIASLFAFFQLKSLKYLTFSRFYKNGVLGLLLFLFFTIIQIFNINGARFYLSYWIVVLFIFSFFINEKKTSLLLLVLASFFHISYLYFSLIAVVCILFSRREKFVLFFLIISFFVSGLAQVVLMNASDYLPPVFSRLINDYASEEAIMEQSKAGSGFSWVNDLFGLIIQIYINMTVLVLYKNRKNVNSQNRNLILFLALYMAFVNISMPIPSLGGRFIAISFPLVAYLWLETFKLKKYNLAIYCVPFVFFMTLYTLSIYYMQVIDVLFLISPPAVLVWKYLLV